ncbi:malectin domain-containing carbohydrate-binding protein [Singulisphaera sp. PoT]|uniref:malectin domain-containing carbohydrate-binding protein n=1 Tax=Singulisphaera sp. PoT TaxID=3411797 RepID=UPI003BF4BF8A
MRPKQARRFARAQPEPLETRRLLSTLIAEIDTGVDLNSAADSPYYDIASGYNAYTQQTAKADGSNIADNSLGSGHGHGSTVADSIVSGIVAAQQSAGSSKPDVKIMPIRVTNNSGTEDSASFNAILRGIFYAAYHNAKVINISIVFAETSDGPGNVPNNPDPSYIKTNPNFADAIAYANSKGAIVVTGAGNDHYNLDSTDPQLNGYYPYGLYPTSVVAPNLMVAASTDSSGNLTSVSNYGPIKVDIGAPAIQNATSYAAGYVSGIAGVVSALAPNMSASHRVDLIESTAQKSAGLTNLIKTGAVISPANAVSALVGPTIATAASANPSTVTASSTTLSVLGAYSSGESSLTYKWSVLSGSGVSFSPSNANGTNSGKSITAQFSQAGNYTFQVTITNQNGSTVSSNVSVTVKAIPSSLSIQPQNASVAAGSSQAFTTSFADQFGNAVGAPTSVNWTASAGTISSSGLFTAPSTGSSSVKITATSGSLSRSIQVPIKSSTSVAGTSIAAGSSVTQGSYSSDTGFSGGSTFSTTAAINTSGVADPAPQAVYQSERWTGTNFSYTVANLTPNSAYTVRLHFAENYFNAPGQRTFNVAINNQSVLTNFDIFAAAGGANKAIVETFTTQSDASGKVTIVFTNVAGGAKVNGIQMIPGASAPQQTGIAIGAGSTSNQGAYLADADYQGGNTFSSTNPIDLSGVSDPAPQAVYQAQRWTGTSFSYVVPNLTPGSTYTIRLHFAEVYYQSAGQRQFDVAINGQKVLSKFDILATAGATNKAVVQTFTATADSSGKVTVTFTNVQGGAEVSGIQVLGSTSIPTQPTTTVIAAGASSASGIFSADADFSGGSVFQTTSPIDTSGMYSPAPESVYQTERYTGTDFTYNVPNLVPGATYLVRLHFAENYFNGADQRKFNVAINGTSVLTNFDIFAAAGAANKAIVRTFSATADANGKVTIKFINVVGGAKVNGIELIKSS